MKEKEIIYQTVRQIIESKKFPFTYGSLRKLIYTNRNGTLSKCIRKIGTKKIALDVNMLNEWIEKEGNI